MRFEKKLIQKTKSLAQKKRKIKQYKLTRNHKRTSLKCITI